jgi:outer membrane protein assembly factor BamB
VYDFGFVACHDAKTGQEIYGRQRIPGGAAFTASPLACNGKLFLLAEDGATHVVQAGPKFAVLRTNPLDELCLASPAAAPGRLLIRTASKLYCLANAAAKPPQAP